MEFIVPTGGGIFTNVVFWAAGHGTNSVPIYGVIWDVTTGAVIAYGAAVTTTGGNSSSPGGDGSWHTSDFSSGGSGDTFIAGGTHIFIGWQSGNGLSVNWAYNGGDHSPDAENNSASGSPSSFSGHTTESPSGAVAAYATYTPVSVPTVTSFSPTVGPVGTAIDVFGTQFTLASDVQFNGVTASFSIVSDTHITATVPSGASTGLISVTNPDGTGNSASNFIVGSLYGDNSSAWAGGVTVFADDSAAWQASQVWIDNGTAWSRLL